jgi:hypothetical protein
MRRSISNGRVLPLLVLLGGIFGCFGGFGLAYWVSVFAYPMNVAIGPLNSWPQFIPVTFETTVLGAALTAFHRDVGSEPASPAVSPGLQRRAFARASTDRFFLVIETTDPRFERYATWKFLEGLHPVGVSEVAP